MIENPLPGYRFIVTLDPGDAYLPAAQVALVATMALASFQEIKGLGAEMELLPYAEGGVNDFVHQLPVRHAWNRISFRRGVVRGPGLWDWYLAGLNQSLGAKRDGAIILQTAMGLPAMTWMFQGGIAVKWNGPELNAMQDAVAIESLEVAHHGLIQIPLSPPGTG
jgi:phage tail-like protein